LQTIKTGLVFFLCKEGPPVILFGGPMLPIVLFWIFVVATLVVFGVDIAQQRRKNNR
jgi:hypothetical protein